MCNAQWTMKKASPGALQAFLHDPAEGSPDSVYAERIEVLGINFSSQLKSLLS
jgi:hypothetical protein